MEGILAAQQAAKTWFDRKHGVPPQYKVGEIVFVRREPVADGLPTKCQPRYREPMPVTKVLSNDNYLVTELDPATTVHFWKGFL